MNQTAHQTVHSGASKAPQAMSADLFSFIKSGIKPGIKSGGLRTGPKQSCALKDAADAHEALTGRRTKGPTIPVP